MTVPNIMKLARSIPIEHGLTFEQITVPSRARRFVRVRREIAIKAREMGYSYPEIGMILGRHHTSIMSLCKNEAEWRKK